jgi:hypothetical protein
MHMASTISSLRDREVSKGAEVGLVGPTYIGPRFSPIVHERVMDESLFGRMSPEDNSRICKVN